MFGKCLMGLVAAALTLALFVCNFLVCSSECRGAAPADAKAQAAAAIAKVRAARLKRGGCACGTSCPCTAGECGDPSCPSLVTQRTSVKSPGPIEWAIYSVQYNKAVSQNKPLLIWVGETCPSCEARWAEYIHARLSEYDPANGTPEKGPAVILCKPDGLGGLDRIGTLRGIPDKSEVVRVLDSGPVIRQTVTFAPQPIFFPPMMPMMPMGGFGGGGFGGGGCGGGG